MLHSGLSRKHQIRLKRPAKDKHSYIASSSVTKEKTLLDFDQSVLRRVVGRRQLERRVDGVRFRVFRVRVPDEPRQREPA